MGFKLYSSLSPLGWLCSNQERSQMDTDPAIDFVSAKLSSTMIKDIRTLTKQVLGPRATVAERAMADAAAFRLQEYYIKAAKSAQRESFIDQILDKKYRSIQKT